MRPLSDSAVVTRFAEQIARRIVKRIIGQLQKMTTSQLSGDDSGLANTWDEICVQVQHEESYAWNVYVQTVESLLNFELERLAAHEREAIWLQTEQGGDWSCDEEEDRATTPIVNAEIVEYLFSSYIYAEAEKWSNPRIRSYLERSLQ